MIEIDGLSFSRGRRQILHGVTFAVESGSVTGLLGPNGAGKSTLLRIAAGVSKADGGVVRVNGRPYPNGWPSTPRVGAFLSAEWIPGSLSAVSFLRHQLELRGRRDSPEGLLKTVGLQHAATKRVRTFSLGMRQRLGIAAALCGDPNVLLLDEPINGVDPEGIAWFRRLTADFAARGGTVLVSSHHMAELEEFATHIVVLNEGRVLRAGELHEFTGTREGKVYLESDRISELLPQLHAAGFDAEPERRGVLVTGAEPADVGAFIVQSGYRLDHLAKVGRTLEQGYFEELGVEQE